MLPSHNLTGGGKFIGKSLDRALPRERVLGYPVIDAIALRGEPRVDFIFMLTRHDETVANCLEVFESIKDLGIRHIGFKDVGVSRETLAKLNQAIKEIGGTSYLEVVSTSEADCLESAQTAIEIGIDRLLGGGCAEAILSRLRGSNIAYYPFPGRPEGHPTRLRGRPEDIAADCRVMDRLGCAGVDLLAYRSDDADPLTLVRAARRELMSDLIVAGSIDTPRQVQNLAAAGVDAFTIGTAVFEETFLPGQAGLRSQLNAILATAA